jgi:hypothetical protein
LSDGASVAYPENLTVYTHLGRPRPCSGNFPSSLSRAIADHRAPPLPAHHLHSRTRVPCHP